MGSSMSSELLEVPLLAQPKPFRWSDRSFVTSAPTTLRIKIPTWRSTAQVFNHETDELLYELKSSFWSARVTLQTPDRAAVCSIKGKSFKDYFRVYDGAETELEWARIHAKDRVFSPLLVFAEFEDKVSRTNCRVLVEGSFSDTYSLVYLERGSPDLSKLEKRENGGHPQYQVVGRIIRQKAGSQEFIEVAAGVDATLVLLLWLVRCSIEQMYVAAVIV